MVAFRSILKMRSLSFFVLFFFKLFFLGKSCFSEQWFEGLVAILNQFRFCLAQFFSLSLRALVSTFA